MQSIVDYFSVLLSILIVYLLIFCNSYKYNFKKIILLYFVLMIFIEIVSFLMAVYNIKNHFLYFFYAVIEVSFAALILVLCNEKYFKKKALPMIVYPVLVISVLGILLDAYYLQRIDIAMTLASIPVLCFCLYLFFHFLDQSEDSSIVIMVMASIFLIHSVSLIILLFSDIIFSFPKYQQLFIFEIRSLNIVIAKLVFIIPFVYKSIKSRQQSTVL